MLWRTLADSGALFDTLADWQTLADLASWTGGLWRTSSRLADFWRTGGLIFWWTEWFLLANWLPRQGRDRAGTGPRARAEQGKAAEDRAHRTR